MELAPADPAKLAEPSPAASVRETSFAPNELRTADLAHFAWGNGQPLPGAAGRGEVRIVDSELGPAVIRHYRRGGALAGVLRDRYWFRGAAATRCFSEFRLLQRLQAMDLPVCRPLAARYLRHGLWYRADLATLLIPAARSLHQVISQSGLQSTVAEKAGTLVARFHAVGLWHADLNAHNILVDADDQYWLIDLDRGRFRRPAGGWRQANLDRLLRSLRKLGHLAHRQSASSVMFIHALRSAYQGQLRSQTGAGA